MDDLYFENELRSKQKECMKKSLEDYRAYFSSKSEISDTTKQVIQKIDDILYSYYMRIYGETESYSKIEEMIESFKRQLTDDKLAEMYSRYNFSPEEKEYIKLAEVSSTWRGYHSYDIGAKFAIIDIFLRAKIIEQFGQESISTFRDIIESELPKSESYRATIMHYTQLFSDKPYGENIHYELKRNIEEKAEYFFNQAINCGGYALKIDQCIFPTGNNNFNQSISALLKEFPFIRLLGDKPLEEDEYLVIYRAPEGKNTGHHFIRIDSDATVREKDANGAPRIFEEWASLRDAPEAIFAVKKEHKMFGYDSIYFNCNSGLDFEESVTQAFRKKQNTFSYHNHEFCLKKSKQDEIFITANDGEIVAIAVANESDCLVEAIESKKEYIQNISGGIVPVISNGKLTNFDKFKRKSIDGFDFELE